MKYAILDIYHHLGHYQPSYASPPECVEMCVFATWDTIFFLRFNTKKLNNEVLIKLGKSHKFSENKVLIPSSGTGTPFGSKKQNHAGATCLLKQRLIACIPQRCQHAVPTSPTLAQHAHNAVVTCSQGGLAFSPHCSCTDSSTH